MPSIARQRGDHLGEVPDPSLLPGSDVDRVRDVEPLGAEQQSARGVVDVEELPGRLPGSPEDHLRLISLGCEGVLVDHRRDHVGVLQVEVVTRAVEIGHHRDAGVEPVLAPVGVREHEVHLLGEPVGRVRLLRVAIPDLVLRERDRGELRIGADRAGGDQLLDSELPGGLEDVQAHLQVVVGEGRRVAPVEPDSADVGREMENHLGALEAPRVVASRSRRSNSAERTTLTSAPSSRSRPVVGLPRKPAPPLTTTRLPDQKPGSGEADAIAGRLAAGFGRGGTRGERHGPKPGERRLAAKCVPS